MGALGLITPAIQPNINVHRLNKTITFGGDATGTSTGVGATTLTDSGASFGTTQYIGKTVFCLGKSAVIVSHTNTVLTFASWTGGTPATGIYIIGDATIAGPVGTATVFSAPGFVIIRELIAVVGAVGLTAGAGATLALGVTGATTVFNAATNASAMTGAGAGGYWFGGAVANVGARPSALTNYLIGPNSPATVFITVAVDAVTAGSINFTAVWDTAEVTSGDLASNFQ